MLNKVKKLIFTAIVFTLVCIPLKAEALGYVDAPQSVPLDQIFVTPKGANSYVEGNNVVITDKKVSQIGSIFSTEQNKMDLSKDFYSEMYIYIDGDADGIAYVMHNDPDKIANFSGLVGSGLSIYGDKVVYGSPNKVGGKQLKNSFAIEFDTYFNGDSYDSGLNKNSDKGHIAYSFPDKLSSYKYKSPSTSITGINHSGLQYPTFKLGDGQWRLLKIQWTAWNASNVGNLTYTFGDLASVSVPISRDTFGTDSVYWGFTGSTGALSEKAVVAFKSVPGLVNYTENVEFMNTEGKKIQSITQDSEVTVHYSGQYTGGKQNMIQPTFKFALSPNQVYQQGTLLLNGVPATPTYINNELAIPLSKDLSATNPIVDIQFKVKDTKVTNDTKLTLTAQAVAKNIISGKDASYDITYDFEAPIGFGKLTFIDAGDSKAISDASDYSTFLLHYEDDFSPKDKIKITLKAGQDIESVVKTVGPSSFQVTLTDEKGNARDVKIPIFVQNQEVAKSSQYIIFGKDFDVAAKDYPKTEEDLLGLIREKAELKLWQYNELSADLIDKSQLNLSIGTLPKPPELAGAGVYEVTASYGSGNTKVDKKIKVTIIQSFATVKIAFVDENNQPIVDDLSFEATISERIDLSQNAQVIEKLKAVKALNYVLDTPPLDEKNLLIVPEGVTRKYTFKGTLFIESAPNAIDFGDQKVSGKNKKFNDPNYDQHLVIWDNRSTLGTWKITLKQSQDFSIPGDPSHRLPNALSYQTTTGEKVISTDAQEVFRSKHQTTGKYDISEETWGPEKQGLRLNVPVGSVKQVGKYETTLTWQIEEAY
ncbi:hypothetical protein A5821_002467 [Enterococcus sp. 7F3_DIV0205]|uniref:WxL domain-containing protein n=1 Tax=Candidatus Enterococcus palustris TaxID=1834189 RepID=A0AAQ3Y800_9ENTE|nr:WxL domain-containing protein [Enterococcus sp. 7F3_DIV0205]OTN82898.1 hypothetical protein A5821_002821 [Enterococcus sp. 7F3_DIV0205]